MSTTPLTIDFDLPCARCGYNLRTLSRRGDCPECGHPVWRSLLGEDLAQADPGWLRLQRLGLLLGLAAVALYVEQAIMLNWRFIRQSNHTEYVLWRVAVPTAAMFLGAAGAWLLTWPEPRRARKVWWADLPTLTRLAIAGHIAAELVALAIWYSSFADTRDGKLCAIFMEGVASRLLGTLYGLCLYLVVARLTRRIPSTILTFSIWLLIVDMLIANLGFAYVAACQMRDIYRRLWNVDYDLLDQMADCAWWVGGPLEMIVTVAIFAAVGRAIHQGRQTVAPPSVALSGELVTNDHRPHPNGGNRSA